MPKEFTKRQGNGVTVFTLESDGGVTGAAAVGSGSVVKPLGAVINRNPKEETIKVPVKQKPRQGPLRPQTGGGAHRDKKKEQKQGKEKHRKPYMEDHEIQMASSELQAIAKNAVRLLDLVRKYSEQEGLEAWQQSKITKAADYLNAVLQSISGEQTHLEALAKPWSRQDMEAGATRPGMSPRPGISQRPVTSLSRPATSLPTPATSRTPSPSRSTPLRTPMSTVQSPSSRVAGMMARLNEPTKTDPKTDELVRQLAQLRDAMVKRNHPGDSPEYVQQQIRLALQGKPFDHMGLEEGWKSALAGAALAGAAALGGGHAQAAEPVVDGPAAMSQQDTGSPSILKQFTPGVKPAGHLGLEYKGQEYKYAGRGVEPPSTDGETIVVPAGYVGIRGLTPTRVLLSSDGKYYSMGFARESRDEYLNQLEAMLEEKVRLDPSCWHNKKIGNPKTKMKGGVRVNNCVPKEGVAEDDEAVRAFLAKGGKIQVGKTHPPRKAEKWQGSAHIGAAGGRGTKGSVSGMSANTNPKGGKPVVSVEGAKFESNYAEQLAQQVFDHNPNIDNENEILNLGYNIAKSDLGSRAQGIFRDEDFPSDFVSAYGYLKKHGVEDAYMESLLGQLEERTKK